MKKTIEHAPLWALLCTAAAHKDIANQHIAVQHIVNSRNGSCLPTRIHPVYLKKSQKTFYIKFKQKKVQQLAYD